MLFTECLTKRQSFLQGKIGLSSHRFEGFHSTKLELRQSFRLLSTHYQSRSELICSIRILFFSGSLNFGCPLRFEKAQSLQADVVSGHPNYVIDCLILLGIFFDQNYGCVVLQCMGTDSTKICQIHQLKTCFSRFSVDYSEELLDNFKTVNALLVTQETLIHKNIESILNSMLLFLPG